MWDLATERPLQLPSLPAPPSAQAEAQLPAISLISRPTGILGQFWYSFWVPPYAILSRSIFFFWNKAPVQVGSCMPFWQMQVRGKQAQSRKVQILAQHHQSWKVKLKSWKQAWTRNELLLKHDSCNQSREASAITTTTAAWKHAGNRDGQGLHGWCSYKQPQNGCLPKA